MSNVLDASKMFFIDAPLTTLPASSVSQYNTAFIKNKAAGASVVAPHFYNKTSFLKSVVDFSATNAAAMSAGVLAEFGNPDFSTWARSEFGSMGRFINNNSSYPLFEYPSMGDWILYYKLDKVKNKKWKWLGSNSGTPKLYDVELGITNDYFVRENGGPQPSQMTYTPMIETGEYTFLVRGGIDTTPTPKTGYNEWYYVSEIGIYNRAIGNVGNRKLIENCFPCVLWDLQGLYLYRDDGGRMKMGSFSGDYQALTEMIFWDYPAYMGGVHALWQLFDWTLFQSHHLYSPVGETARILSEITSHHNNNKNIALIGASRSDAVMKVWGNASNDITYYRPEIFVQFEGTYSLSTVPVFKTEQDFINLLADWGITRITNNLEDAQTLPAELLPDSGGGFVPSGGDSSGYDDNPVIPNIPAFPDNTSDNVEIISPNITGLNAASVYALSLTSTQNFLKWLMSDSFIDNISNLFTDKLSALNDLKLMPFDIVNHDTAHATASNQLTLANVSTEIPCYKIQAGYNCIVDGGKYQYTAYWGNFNDYTAANYYLYVPYGGIVELSPSHVVNCELSIKYAVDLMTGNATAVIYSNGVLVKTLPCQMSQPVPITFTNTNQRDIKNALTALSVVSGIGGTVANAAVGNVGGAVSSGLGVLGTIAGGIANNPLKIGSVGNFGSGTAFAMPQNAFLIISRAQLSNPSGLAGIAGRPSNIYTTISSFVGSGFVQINVSHINTAATTAEQQQIIDLLRGGIFI